MATVELGEHLAVDTETHRVGAPGMVDGLDFEQDRPGRTRRGRHHLLEGRGAASYDDLVPAHTDLVVRAVVHVHREPGLTRAAGIDQCTGPAVVVLLTAPDEDRLERVEGGVGA